MKQLIVLLLLSSSVAFFSTTASAQSNRTYEAAIAKATTELKTTYNLDEGQTQKIRQVQQWKYEDLQELEVLKTSQPELYLRKRQGVFQQTKGRVRQVLTSQQQLVFDAKQLEEKQKKEALLQQKQAAGADKMEIQNLLLELERY